MTSEEHVQSWYNTSKPNVITACILELTKKRIDSFESKSLMKECLTVI